MDMVMLITCVVLRRFTDEAEPEANAFLFLSSFLEEKVILIYMRRRIRFLV